MNHVKSKVLRGLAALASSSALAVLVAVAPVSAVSTTQLLSASETAAGQLTTNTATLHAGVATVTINNQNPNADIETFQPTNGATLADVNTHLQAVGAGGTAAATAMQWFEQHSIFHGGLSSGLGRITYQKVLAAGTYYIADLHNLPGAAVSFSVSGSSSEQLQPTNQYIRETGSGTTEHFVVTGATGSPALYRGCVRVANQTTQLHFAGFAQVVSGTTDAQVQAFYNGTGSDPTVQSGTVSFGTLSANQSVNLNLQLAPATYNVASFIPDDQTGTAQAVLGMHKVFTVLP
jgi:hypothetical protein